MTRAITLALFAMTLAGPAAAACRLIHVRNPVTQRIVPVNVCGWGESIRAKRHSGLNAPAKTEGRAA